MKTVGTNVALDDVGVDERKQKRFCLGEKHLVVGVALGVCSVTTTIAPVGDKIPARHCVERVARLEPKRKRNVPSVATPCPFPSSYRPRSLPARCEDADASLLSPLHSRERLTPSAPKSIFLAQARRACALSLFCKRHSKTLHVLLEARRGMEAQWRSVDWYSRRHTLDCKMNRLCY